jgi:hypothetical protein
MSNTLGVGYTLQPITGWLEVGTVHGGDMNPERAKVVDA